MRVRKIKMTFLKIALDASSQLRCLLAKIEPKVSIFAVISANTADITPAMEKSLSRLDMKLSESVK